MINLDVADIARDAQIVRTHNDSRERWIGKLAVPAGNKVTDSGSKTPFQLVAGNDTWGTEVLVVDSADSPFVSAGNPYFHISRVFLTATNSTTIWKIRGVSSYVSLAEGLAAGRFTEMMMVAPSPIVDAGPVDVRAPRLPVGIKVWFQAWNFGENGKTLDLFYSIHEYGV